MERKFRSALIVLLGLNSGFVAAHTASQTPDTYAHAGATSTTQDTSPHFGQSYGPVKNQTLWNISKQLVKNSEFSIQQGVDAIVAKNPQSFRGGNAHHIKKDVVLHLPTREEMVTHSDVSTSHSDARSMHSEADTKPVASSSDYDVYVKHAPFATEITSEEE